jgi:SSS family solute:Na+ symporter
VIAKAPEKLAFDKGYSWPMYTSMVLMMMWGFISWPQIFIRAYAAKSKKIIRLTSALGPIGAFIAYVPMMIAAFAILAASTQKFPAPDKALLTELGQYAPIWFFGIAGVAVLASAMSTFDSQAHVAGVILAKDIFQKLCKIEDEKKIFRFCRIVIAVGLLASYLMSLKPPKLMWDILISSYAGVSQLVPPLIAALYWKRATREGAAVGLVAGLVIALLFSFVWVHPLGIHAGLWGMVINTVLLIVISYGSKQPSQEILRAFYK